MPRNDEAYFQDIERMLEAAHAWRLIHPTAVLKFRGIGPRGNVVITGSLDAAMIDKLGETDDARDLLRTIDGVSVNGGASIYQAEFVIAEVFGFQQAFRWMT